MELNTQSGIIHNGAGGSIFQGHPKSFVHLHLHTQYSLLDGAIRIKDLIQRAVEYNMPAIAQTDHGNMFGAIDFYNTARKAGIKPLLGSEIYFTPGSRFDRRPAGTGTSKVLNSQDEIEGRHRIHHLILLCKNQTGYENLCQLLSKAYMEGFYYKPRVDVEILKQYSEGLIATTACLKGEVGYNFFTGKDDVAGKAIEKLHEIFCDDFYLEIQENGIPEQAEVNRKVIAYSKKHSIPVVATNDAHYLTRDDAMAQEVLLCVQTGKTFADEKRMKLTTSEFYVKSPEEMRKNFDYYPEACDNTLRIADKCNLEFQWQDSKGKQIYHLPNFPIETEETSDEYFARSSREGLEMRFVGPHFAKLRNDPQWEATLKPSYSKRLEDEIVMIQQTGFAGYFLIVSDFINWAKTNTIAVGPGRGSGAGSLVAYALNITNINPIPFNLLFERFINPERVSMPDFDVDFCQDRRGEVIDYVTKKYGSERVGQIITFGKLQAKAVIRDVSRVFDLPYSEADMLAKLVPDELGITLEKAIEKEPKLQELRDKDPKIRQILKVSKRLEGLLRHASIHAAGVIITSQPLVKYCPLFKGREGEQVVQFDKDFSEQIGLVKFDFLGLKTLTVIDHASRFIRRDFDPTFDIETIDLEDKAVYKFVSTGETTGVFQLESVGMKDLCKRLKPDTLDDITAINALYRPGPLGSGMVDDFVEIKHGRKAMTFPFPQLRPVLQDTYGIIVYQEQVMNISRIVAGYTLGQADILRKAMGKKKMDVMEEHRKIFAAGALKNGFDTNKAVELFDLMAKFAEYGFNKSHAVAYALIAFQTAFLKHYYPACFFSALLSTELSNTDKITNYIKDALNFGVETLPPDINESLYPFNVIGNNIRFGLGAIKNVGEGVVEEIVREREKNGPFSGLINFCERVSTKALNKRVIESMIKVGVFDQAESQNKKMNRSTLLHNLEKIVHYSSKIQEEKGQGQGNLFALLDEGDGDGGTSSGLNPFDLLDIEERPDFDQKEKLKYEVELMGIYVSGHPLAPYEDIMRQMSSVDISEVADLQGENKRDIILSGMFSSHKTLLTKKGDRMAFATLEDLHGKIECILFPKVFAQYEKYLTSDSPLVLEGEVNLSEEPRKFFPKKISELKEQTEEMVSEIRIQVNLESLHEHSLTNLRDILMEHRGVVPAHIIFESTLGRARFPLGERFLVSASPRMATKINAIFQNNCVKFIVNGKLESQGLASAMAH